MKACILGLMLLGLTNLTFSQNEVAVNDVNKNFQFAKLKTHSKATTTSQISKRIVNFQNEVSKYDITSKQIFTPNKPATYTVVFKEAKNIITNIYSHDGEVISSEQKFEAIRLPDNIIHRIAKEHPNWSIKSVSCIIKYEKNKHTIVTYKLRIISGTKTKIVKVIV